MKKEGWGKMGTNNRRKCCSNYLNFGYAKKWVYILTYNN